MSVRNVILYIAVSLDGYIAKENGDIGWLSTVVNPPEDYDYEDFIKTTDTVIMRRNTYDKVLSMGIDFPYSSKKCYVLSHQKKDKDEKVEFFHGDIGKLIVKIRKTKGSDIYCSGGADLISELMKQYLINKYIISVLPVLMGNGISLFKPGRLEQKLKFLRSIDFPTGLVQLWYNNITS